jgi:[NiFe] hydrogenase small subunit
MDSNERFDTKLEEGISALVEKKGVTRRDFMKFCGIMAATLGLEASFIPKIAEAIVSGQRPPVIWLQFSECTGCTEAFLRTSRPFIDDLLLNKMSLEYHETIMAPAGEAALKSLSDAVSQYDGKYIVIVEGSIPTANNGVYGMTAGKTMLDIAQEVCSKAKMMVSLGTCASFGGLPAAKGGLTGAKSVHGALGGLNNIMMPGCPPNPVNFAALLVNYLLFSDFPTLDTLGRPTFAYGSTVHSQCQRLDTAWCLAGFGCRGPATYHNCPTVRYNDKTSWCVQADVPCKGCSQPGFWDAGSFFNYAGAYAGSASSGGSSVDDD